jgi:hypothetical protein
MGILEIARGQRVRIPAIQLTDGRLFEGVVRASDGESLIIDLSTPGQGTVPSKVDDMVVLTWDSGGFNRACPILVRQSDARSITSQVVIQERREAPRLRIDMHLSYERVPPERVRDTADEVMSRMHEEAVAPETVSAWMRKGDDELGQIHLEIQGLQQMLREVLSRLDHLTSLAMGEEAAPTGDPQSQLLIMNVSSTGVGYIGGEPLQPGDYLKMRMVIHSTPQTVIECMGVVVRCLKAKPAAGYPTTPFDVGVRFTHIHETDRERLIHYLFKVQRRILRDRKEARLALAEQE